MCVFMGDKGSVSLVSSTLHSKHPMRSNRQPIHVYMTFYEFLFELRVPYMINRNFFNASIDTGCGDPNGVAHVPSLTAQNCTLRLLRIDNVDELWLERSASYEESVHVGLSRCKKI